MTFDPGNVRDVASPALARAPVRAASAARLDSAPARRPATAGLSPLPSALKPAPAPCVVDRVIHARNAGAYGYFEAYGRVGDEPASRFTCARLFHTRGAKTPLFVRFSTVAHGGHGPETVRDPRGFSIRFYTEDGRWDLVGSNLPVSFVRDPTLFPSVAHAFRPEPVTHRLNPQRIFDFIRLTPSALHMVTWLFSPWGIPANYRAMHGFASGRWIGSDGAATDVRYHLRPKHAERNLTQAEADALQARNFNHATQDLHEAIARGDFPEWELAVQLIGRDDRADLDFDPLDPTAVWPIERFPLRPLGRVVLDRNPKNYFAEVEQVTFDPKSRIDGLAPASDPEPGSASHAPGVAFAGRTRARELQRLTVGRHTAAPAPDDNHRRAGECYRRFEPWERDELVGNLVAALRECDTAVRTRMVEHFRACDPDYGRRVAEGLGMAD